MIGMSPQTKKKPAAAKTVCDALLKLKLLKLEVQDEVGTDESSIARLSGNKCEAGAGTVQYTSWVIGGGGPG